MQRLIENTAKFVSHGRDIKKFLEKKRNNIRRNAKKNWKRISNSGKIIKAK